MAWVGLIPWLWLCCIALFIYKITKIVRMLWLAERHVCMTVWLWRQDFISGLHNCLKFSQPPLCLYQAMQTWKMFPITLSHNPFFCRMNFTKDYGLYVEGWLLWLTLVLMIIKASSSSPLEPHPSWMESIQYLER